MEHQDLQHPLTDAQIEAKKTSNLEALIQRVNELESRVSILEKK